MYQLKNITGRQKTINRKERPLSIDNTIVRSGESYYFSVPTHDVCSELEANTIEIYNDDHLIRRLSDFKAYDIEKTTKEVRKSTVDGVVVSYKAVYNITPVNEEPTEENTSPETAPEPAEKNVEEPSAEDVEEEEQEGDSSEPTLLEELANRDIHSSTDLNLSNLIPLMEKRGDELPLSFFEDDDRKGTKEALEDLDLN